MSTTDHRLTEDLARALPGRGRRPWEQHALRLVEPAPADPVTLALATPVTGPPGPPSGLEAAIEAVTWAATSEEYQEAQARLGALLTGQPQAAERPAPLPSTANGWVVTKTLQRDGRGLIETVTERWAPVQDV